jgi:hypothetical protein
MRKGLRSSEAGIFAGPPHRRPQNGRAATGRQKAPPENSQKYLQKTLDKQIPNC